MAKVNAQLRGVSPASQVQDNLSPRQGPPPRVVIEGVTPLIDGGRFAAKRIRGQQVDVSADIFTEGHDQLAAVLRYRQGDDETWRETPMEPLGNDRWTGRFLVSELGGYSCGIEAWVDAFASWQRGVRRKIDAEQDVSSELLEGAELVRAAAERAGGEDATWLQRQAQVLANPRAGGRHAGATSEELADMMARYPDRARSVSFEQPIRFWVDRERAGFAAWYELFPRSTGPEPGEHGTFRDCLLLLPTIAAMGFDVVYLPPIHPIGTTHRKGPNNTPAARPGDPGSPWGIGSPEGGHTTIHPQLGTLAEFDQLVREAARLDLEIALDLAFQCSPDHPYVREHPSWFRWRPDGTIQYAENPPKKYQDIYPLNFDSEDWAELWRELKRVVEFWIGHGIKIFRVDNPHTKPFPFWEWLISEIQRDHPEVVFLSEAFTRPRVLEYLAKLGFTQSYTYFTWRNTKDELVEYFRYLNETPVREYLRPNLFVNTPDILHEFLQTGGLPAARLRLVLAATLAGSYGIYGPGFELGDYSAVSGTEEYQDSEKYQIRHWHRADPASLAPFIRRVNTIRRENRAFRDGELLILPTDNDELIGYARATPELDNVLVIVVSLDPNHPQTGWVELPLERLGIALDQQFQVHDLLGDARYLWHGPRNFIALHPQTSPAHIFRVRRRIKTERDFDYFM